MGDLEGAAIIGLASGDCQTLALDLSGRVYGWGCFKDKVLVSSVVKNYCCCASSCYMSFFLFLTLFTLIGATVNRLVYCVVLYCIFCLFANTRLSLFFVSATNTKSSMILV